jgi:maleylpyruvate isomerase
VDTAQRRLRDQIDDATQRLLSTARVIPEADLRAPSLLPGWTRAYVLAHVARGADAMRQLLIGARDGQERPAFASAGDWATATEQAAGQQPADLAADVAASAMAWRTVAGQLSEQAWRFQVMGPGATPFPAGQLLTRRLVEVELHHCDLGLGYGPADWSEAFAAMDLAEPMLSQRQDRLARVSGRA